MRNASTTNRKSQGSPTVKEIPVYLRIARELKDDIFAGHYPVGAHLPTEEQLAQTYGIAGHHRSVRPCASCARKGWSCPGVDRERACFPRNRVIQFPPCGVDQRLPELCGKLGLRHPGHRIAKDAKGLRIRVGYRPTRIGWQFTGCRARMARNSPNAGSNFTCTRTMRRSAGLSPHIPDRSSSSSKTCSARRSSSSLRRYGRTRP